jgi:hypothetical protein
MPIRASREGNLKTGEIREADLAGDMKFMACSAVTSPANGCCCKLGSGHMERTSATERGGQLIRGNRSFD